MLLPKSVNPQRMQANLQCGDGSIVISDEDMAALDALTDADSATTFEAHFAKRAVVDTSSPTIALGYGPPPPTDRGGAAGAEEL